MTDQISFGRLVDVSAREAWAHEAHRFTPWLADNLDRLSDAIGIPIELSGREVGVGRYSADILARNPQDDSLILIENQLEFSDHTHLGQILTYLAGLDAKVMIWVAPDFREEHLSALRWLNEHTVEPFAFFAVRLRVVRIGDSPMAPLFEVVERPNNWDRQVSAVRREAESGISDLGTFRRSFWTHFCERYPSEGTPDATTSRWRPVPGTSMVVVQYLAQKGVGIFVRPAWKGDRDALLSLLSSQLAELETLFDAVTNSRAGILGKTLSIDSRDSANWDRMSDWLHEQAEHYSNVLSERFGEENEESA